VKFDTIEGPVFNAILSTCTGALVATDLARKILLFPAADFQARCACMPYAVVLEHVSPRVASSATRDRQHLFFFQQNFADYWPLARRKKQFNLALLQGGKGIHWQLEERWSTIRRMFSSNVALLSTYI